jgi:hypothetical protein
MSNVPTPDVMPVLSRGKHRNARKGACFMELASYLAGEPWSDHPSCTHPLLAALARSVNDSVGDYSRSQLATLVPEVVGLTSEDPRVDAWIARDAAMAALPIASFERQKVAAVGVLSCERRLNGLEGRPLDELSAASSAALDDVPHAREWAARFTHLGYGRSRSFSRRSAPAIVHCAVKAISQASVGDPDAILVELLRSTVDNCRTWFAAPTEAVVPEDGWQRMCDLTRPR